MGHIFDRHNAFLSEGRVLAIVVGEFPETPHQARDETDFPRPLRESEARLRPAGPPPARRNGAPHERGAGGESDLIFAADTPPGRGKWATLKATIYPPLRGVALTTVVPSGKAEELKTRTWVVLLNLAWIAT